ncbi:MAG: prenyltransferase/squalene oxidase repeat-containing protein, partial [Verrucomicrobiota bacterium]
MKLPFLILTTAILTCSPLLAEEPIAQKSELASLTRSQIETAIGRGLEWLAANQKPEGNWSNAEHPALTALPLIAFHREPTGKYRDGKSPFLTKGFDFIRAKVQPDGGIYVKGLSNYNTSLALLALLETHDAKDEPLIARARDFIIAQQARGMANESLEGGIGYGPTGVSPKRQHPDLDNTYIALESLHAFRASRPNAEPKNDLNWQAAIDFISRTQNLPSHNPKGSAEPADKGGLIYYPGYSNADPADGPKALRSYGTMTYAGLLSFIYADLKKDDPRVVAALEWLTKNFTLEENPGMGRAGLYYYYHLMSKGLVAARVDKLQLPDGSQVDWAP